MKEFRTGTRTTFARQVSAEVRARIAAQRITQRDLADGAGFTSHNYVAIRLRDERPFTLDDIERICAFLGESAQELIAQAVRNQAGHIHDLLGDAVKDRDHLAAVASTETTIEPGDLED